MLAARLRRAGIDVAAVCARRHIQPTRLLAFGMHALRAGVPGSLHRKTPADRGIVSPTNGIAILCDAMYCALNLTRRDTVDSPGSPPPQRARSSSWSWNCAAARWCWRYCPSCAIPGTAFRCARPWPGAGCRSRKARSIPSCAGGIPGVLASEWRIEEGPPRRYYRLNTAGNALLAELTATWNALVGTTATVERAVRIASSFSSCPRPIAAPMSSSR